MRSQTRRFEVLEKELYDEYFNYEREMYTLLKDIPNKPKKSTRNILYYYSLLNVDEVGNMICDLFDIYENKKVICKKGK